MKTRLEAFLRDSSHSSDFHSTLQIELLFTYFRSLTKLYDILIPMTIERGIQSGSWEEDNGAIPLSLAETFIQANPDITVIRDMIGDIRITQTFPDKWRHITLDVEHEKGSQRHYPTVLIQAYETQTYHYGHEDVVSDIRRHGLITVVKLHVEADELVTPEVGYGERLRYPRDFGAHYVRYIEKYSLPISAQELVTTARTGLEMLKAYQEASYEQRHRIHDLRTGCDGRTPLLDGTRPDMDAYLAEAFPKLGDVMRSEGISYAYVGTKSIYALNALNKVNNAMLPEEMPSVPQNRRETRQRLIQE